jgi:hypothetical protein
MTDRTKPPETGTEWDNLTGHLDFLRSTVVWKAAGLTDEQARRRVLAPSALSVASIVKHLTCVERFWFSIDFAGHDLPHPWTADDPHGCFRLDPGDTIAGLVAAYQAECERSRRAIDGFGLDDAALTDGMDFTLRFALAHMIEETARHCGHLDLLREHLDGLTGV